MPRITQSHHLTIRVTEEIYNTIQKKANITNVTVSEYIRAIIRKELKEQNEIENRYGYDPAGRILQE